MITDSHIRISVIDGALEIVRYKKKYPHLEIPNLIQQLQNGPSHVANLDLDLGLKLIDYLGIENIKISENRVYELNQILFEIIRKLRPKFAYFSVYGRDRVISFLNDDQKQCFQYSQLLETIPSEQTVNWWDSVAQLFRATTNDIKLNAGRRGERLSIKYEQQKLRELNLNDIVPKWIAVENNVAGYDIMSYRYDDLGNLVNLHIEVKTYASPPPKIILTRNEWKFALEHQNSYLIHVWDTATEFLRILTVKDILPHIPINSGFGNWLDVEIEISFLLENSMK